MTGMGSRIAALLASAAMLLAGGVVPGAYADEPTQAPAADAAGTTVTNAKAFAEALTSCNASKTATTIVVGADFTLTSGEINDSNNKVVCPLTIISDGGNWTVTWEGTGSMLWPQAGSTVTVGVSGTSGASGENAVAGNRLTFTHPKDENTYGPLFHNYGTLIIHGGTFTGLRVKKGGVAQNNGTLNVDGGVFKDNVSTTDGGGVFLQEGSPVGSITISGGEFEGNAHTGNTERSGGGAIRTTIGSLTISGGTFNGNHTSTTRGFAGGGAVYATGVLTLKGNPVFEGNWTHPGDKTGEDPIVGAGADGGSAAGAGGAIFLQENSTGYLMGGTFVKNESGYLGGAIYTEEGTLSYVGKTAATGNTAGHFGGGLWLCPSGNADSSKGGNIALWNNKVDNDLDSNNQDSNGMAGDDFAMMNPSNKNIAKTEFELMDTWFTSRVQTAVQWMVDGEPAKDASGYNRARFKVNETQEQTAGKPYDPGTITLKNTDNFGVALKAQVLDGIDTTAVYNSAELKFTGNRAKWDGGAIGSNGRLSFSTPHTAAWGKIDAANPDPTKDSTFLSGSSWRLSTTDGGAENSDLGEDANCKTDPTADTCWTHRKGDAGNVKSIIVADNGDRDNNPADGRFSVDNLKAGTYTLTEEVAPGGFEKTDAAYTFTITENQKEVPKLSVDETHTSTLVDGRYITNQRPAGLAWSKTDAKTGGLLEEPEWTITYPNKTKVTVTDCVADESDGCADQTDKDNTAGRFHVEGLTQGNGYTLQETKAPAGHWLDKATYTFNIKGTKDEKVQLQQGDTLMSSNTIVNKPTEVSWLKVGAGDDTPLKGSEWTLKRENGANLTTVYESVTDCVLDQNSKGQTCDGPDKDETAGKFTLTGLETGTYELTESKAPAGYVKSDKTYTFEITETEPETAVAIKDGDSVVTDNKIVNTKVLAALPLTGGRSALDWAVAGGVLAVLAVGVAVVQDRLRRRALGL